MMKKIFAFWLAVLIEYRWFWIMHYRKKGNHLLEHGEALSSDRLIKLTKKIDHHGIIAFRLQDQYEALEMLSR